MVSLTVSTLRMTGMSRSTVVLLRTGTTLKTLLAKGDLMSQLDSENTVRGAGCYVNLLL